ncbi:hypothetical protein KAM621c_07890 [Citrobacter braakii]|uniref:Resolvase/invertase-type recombinase catalytic domain-containing protein n=1 Tax=Citrobacter braakii TaxID=57706 RepID=A0AAD1KYZ3_CITBR|nr:hypothetical protein KAM621c_07890 [Citrobacter braakii]
MIAKATYKPVHFQSKWSLCQLWYQMGIAGWYVENASGAALHRPELMRLLQDAEPGDAIVIEQVDRLSRLDDNGWESLKKMIHEKSLSIISLDLPTSHIALSKSSTDDFTRSMLRAVNNMMLDMLAAIARKDYEDRRRRQMEGITSARGRENTGEGWQTRENMNK